MIDLLIVVRMEGVVALDLPIEMAPVDMVVVVVVSEMETVPAEVDSAVLVAEAAVE